MDHSKDYQPRLWRWTAVKALGVWISLLMLSQCYAQIELEAKNVIRPVTADFSLTAAETRNALGPFGTRARPIDLETQAFDKAKKTLKLNLKLFDDVKLVTNLNQTASLTRDSVCWTGSIDKDKHSLVVIVTRQAPVANKNVVTRETLAFAQVITGTGQVFVIEPLREGIHLVREIRHSPDHNIHAVVPDLKIPFASKTPPISLPPNYVVNIDVLIAYTRQARKKAGGKDKMLGLIEKSVCLTNEVFSNSGILCHLRISDTLEIDFDENVTFRDMLDKLQTNTEVLSKRQASKADMVNLVVDRLGCGIAFRMGEGMNLPVFGDYAFSVVSRDCMVDQYSFPHELAHNMGCCDNKPKPADPLFPFAFGRRIQVPGKKVGTIMCHPSLCKHRIPYFSNPNGITYMGKPIGVADKSDAAQTINATRGTVSIFQN